jgi:ParB family chromosome partitioning protein
MTMQSMSGLIRAVPFGQLFLSPHNVRKTDSEEGIPELAALIEAEGGVLQNLAGYEESSKGKKRCKRIGVVAGGRRWRALNLLFKKGKIKADYLVPCLVTTEKRAIAISLAENSARRALHPADEFVAFRDLVNNGRTLEEVAANFSVTPLVVQRRLKLANVHPDFLDLYRQGKISIDHMMAFAVTDDHEKQLAAWTSLPANQRSAYSLRCLLTETEIAANAPIVRFVGLKTYQKAGGQVRADLFPQHDGESQFILDTALINRLAQEKLTKEAEKLKAAGCAWVEVNPRSDLSDRSRYSQVRCIEREPDAQAQVQRAKWHAERADIEAQIETEQVEGDALDALYQRLSAIEESEQDLRQALSIPDPEQQALAGARLSIGHDGKICAETGLLRPEDAKRFAVTASTEQRLPEQEGSRTHSAALVLYLTAHRTRALQATLAQNPGVALAALAQQFVMHEFYGSARVYEGGLKIQAETVQLDRFAKDLGVCRAFQALQAQREALRSKLPSDPKELFAWLLSQPQSEVVALLAFCTAQSVDSVANHEGATSTDAISNAVHFDLRKWWTPTAEGYLARVKKTAILTAVTEAVSAEAAAKIDMLKKTPLAQAAEKLLAGTGWLPSFLRGVSAE